MWGQKAGIKHASISKESVYYVGDISPNPRAGTVTYALYELPRKEAEHMKRLGEDLKTAKEDFNRRMKALKTQAFEGEISLLQYAAAERKLRAEHKKKTEPLQNEYNRRLGLKFTGYFTTDAEHKLHEIIEKDKVILDQRSDTTTGSRAPT